MDLKTLALAVFTLFSWGIGSFVAKLATNKIGDKAVFWDVMGYAPAIIIFSILIFNAKNLVSSDKGGMFLAFLAGAIGSLGAIGFYMMLTRKDASSAVPLTALYPVLTAILAIIFLNEKLTVIKLIGIILSGSALFLLSL